MNKMNDNIKRPITRRKSLQIEEVEDYIAVEQILKLSLNGKEVVNLYCTPTMVRELVVGFCMTEEIVNGKLCIDDMTIKYGKEITVDIPAAGEVNTGGLTITSGCVGGITFNRKKNIKKITDPFTIKASTLKAIFEEFRQKADLFKLTGCVHSAALSDARKLLIFAEDIGRHNAVDKVIGAAIIEGISFSEKIMLVSGRLSSEIAYKCALWGIPIVASRTAPTDLAVRIAEDSGVTLIGFVRGDRMNIYTYPQRIL